MQKAKKENTSRPKTGTRICSIDITFYKLKLDKDSAIKTAVKDTKRKPLIFFFEGTLKCKCNITRYIVEAVGKRIWKYKTDTKIIFKKLMDTLNKGAALEDDLFHTEQYMGCIENKSLERVDGDKRN